MEKKHNDEQSSAPNSSGSDAAAYPIPDQDWAQLAAVVMEESSRSEEDLEEFKLTVWPNLSKSERNKVDAQTEDYVDMADYVERERLSAGARRALAEDLPALDAYEELIHTSVRSLFADPRVRPGSHHDREREEYVRNQIEALLSRINSVCKTAFDVPTAAHRPISKEELHRYWSKMIYEGRTYRDLADEASLGASEPVHEDHVKKSVLRHRERRKELQWMLRYAIYKRSQGT
jgi:hypothetical protein